MFKRYYSQHLARFLSTDPVGGSVGSSQSWNKYVYCLNNPISVIDPDGLSAIAVAFPDYKVGVGKLRAPLGHSGIVLINDRTGYAKYYEFGMYRLFGKVRERSVPSVDIGGNGRPTVKSLNKLMAAISRDSGQGGKVVGAYFQDADYDAMLKYAAALVDPLVKTLCEPIEHHLGFRKSCIYNTRHLAELAISAENGVFTAESLVGTMNGAYDILVNNCASFQGDVLEAGGVDTPLMIDPRPESYINELLEGADAELLSSGTDPDLVVIRTEQGFQFAN